eukprot:jgi/Hompol1/4456/HPOL_007112-RA
MSQLVHHCMVQSHMPELRLATLVLSRTKALVRNIGPTKSVVLSLDGPAPIAKLRLQQQRRARMLLQSGYDGYVGLDGQSEQAGQDQRGMRGSERVTSQQNGSLSHASNDGGVGGRDALGAAQSNTGQTADGYSSDAGSAINAGRQGNGSSVFGTERGNNMISRLDFSPGSGFYTRLEARLLRELAPRPG